MNLSSSCGSDGTSDDKVPKLSFSARSWTSLLSPRSGVVALVETPDTILASECLKLLKRVLVLFATDAPTLSALLVLLCTDEKLVRVWGKSIGESGGSSTSSTGREATSARTGAGICLVSCLSCPAPGASVGVFCFEALTSARRFETNGVTVRIVVACGGGGGGA